MGESLVTVRILLRLALLIIPACLSIAQEAPQPPTMNILILYGEGAINNIKQRTSRETIVQVEDENHRPIAGAVIIFQLPADGPGGVFVGGSKTVSLVSDAQGKVVMTHIQPSQVMGNFQIHVNASFQGRQASTVIHQAIGPTPAGPNPVHAAHGKTIGIVAGVVAAGAIAAAVALTRNNAPTVTIPTGTITAGNGATLGAPPQ